MAQPFMTIPTAEITGDAELKDILNKAQSEAKAEHVSPDPLVETAEQKAPEPQRICPLCKSATLFPEWNFCPTCGAHANILSRHEFPVNVIDILLKGFCEAEFEIVKGAVSVKLRSMTIQDHDIFLEWVRSLDKPLSSLQVNSKLRVARVAACLVSFNGQPFVDKVLSVSDTIEESAYLASLNARCKKLMSMSDAVVDRILAVHTEFCHHVDRKLSDPGLVGNS